MYCMLFSGDNDESEKEREAENERVATYEQLPS